MKRALFCGVAAIAVAAFLVATPVRLSAQNVPIDGKIISGVVKSPHGPEAGVWVIAETDDLGTRFAKMVVTDDCRTCRKPNIKCGCAAMAWSIPPRSTASRASV
jgi:hypothetical protein